jgi:hypothetical protein
LTIGAPFVSWVALGWGEPVVPWWGRAGFVGRPWWGGWGGPRVVNNVVVNRTTVVNVTNINVYRNVNVRNAVVAVRPDRFGRGPVGEARIRQVDTRRLEPVRGAVDLRPDRSSFAAAGGRGIRPPERVLERGVVATRAPVTRALPREPEGRGPSPRIVPAPRPTEVGESRLERARPARAPRFENARRPDATPPAARREDPTGPERGRRPEAQRVPEPPRTSEPRRAPEPRAPETPRGPEPGRAPQVQRPPQVQRAPEGSAERRTPADVPRQPRREGVDRPRAAERPAAPVPRQVERRAAPAPQSRQVERPTTPTPQPRQVERPTAPTPPPRQVERPTAPTPQPRQIERRVAPTPPPRQIERPVPQPRVERPAAPRPQPRVLSGEPANRRNREGRVERATPRGPESRPMARPRPAQERGGGRDRGPARGQR